MGQHNDLAHQRQGFHLAHPERPVLGHTMRKTPVVFAIRAILTTCQVLLIIGVLCVTTACMSGGGARSSAASQNGQNALFKEWQIIDTKTGQPVSLDQWAGLLLQQDIIYLRGTSQSVSYRRGADGAAVAEGGGAHTGLSHGDVRLGWSNGAGSVCIRVRHEPSGIPRGSPVETELGRPVRGL